MGFAGAVLGADQVRRPDLNTSQAPVVFRTNMEAGHGGKSGRFRRYREQAEMYAFMLDQLGVEAGKANCPAPPHRPPGRRSIGTSCPDSGRRPSCPPMPPRLAGASVPADDALGVVAARLRQPRAGDRRHRRAGLPTVPFVLLAAFAAASRFRTLARAPAGRPAWPGDPSTGEREGAVSRQAKRLATAMMSICAVLMFATAPRAWMAGIGTLVMAVVAAWLWRRPEPRH